MNTTKKTILIAAIGLALLGAAGAGFASAYTATRERDRLAHDMQEVRETVIPHSFAFTLGLTGPKRDKETVLWASDMARAAGVRIGDEVHFRPVAALYLSLNETVEKYGKTTTNLWNGPGADGYSTTTTVLPRDIPMVLWLKHADGTTTAIRV